MGDAARPGAQTPWLRLVVAVAGSALIHVWLAWGLPIKPLRPVADPGSTLQARLMSAVALPEPAALPARAAQTVPDLRPVKTAAPVPSAVTPAPDALPDPTPAEAVEVQRPPPAVDGPPGIPVPQIEDPEFYPSRLLDEYPKPVAEVRLRYPDKADTEERSGMVTLLLLIDDLGMVVEATVVEADPPGYFEEAAIEAFKGALFTPGVRNGHPVKSRLVVQVAFDAKTESLRR